MMKLKYFAIMLGLSMSAQSLSTAQEPPELGHSPGNSLFYLQFAGSKLVDSYQETEILGQHLKSEKGKHLIQMVNQSLAAKLGKSISSSALKPFAEGLNAETLETLLEDLERNESMIRLDYGDFPSKRLSMAINLDESSMQRWLGVLQKLAVSSKVDLFEVSGFPGRQIRNHDQRLNWIQAGSWLLIGIVDSSSGDLSRMVESIKKSGRPFPAEGKHILSMQIKPEQFISLQLDADLHPKKVRVELSGTGTSLRTEFNIQLNKDPELHMETWNVPYEQIQDPLISFTTARGFFHLFQKIGFMPVELPDGIDDQFYGWSQFNSIAASGQSAVPAKEAGEIVRSMAPNLLKQFNTVVEKLPLSLVQYSEENNAIFWQNLPVFTPVISPTEDNRFIRGFIFPPMNSKKAPPPELFQQFKGKENLIYYHWEMTGARINQWQRLYQLLSLFSTKPSFNLKSVAQGWVQELAENLSDTATEISLEKDNSLVLVRRSKSLLDAFELVTLGWWIDQGNFPDKMLAFPFEPLKTKANTTKRAE